MKKIKTLLKNNKYTLTLTVFFALLLVSILYADFIDGLLKDKSFAETNYKYEEKFDLKYVPSGIILWKHGVPEYPMNFSSTDSTYHYEYYDVGIYDSEKGVVYKVRVPFYAYGLFFRKKIDTSNFRKLPLTPPKEDKIDEKPTYKYFKEINL